MGTDGFSPPSSNTGTFRRALDTLTHGFAPYAVFTLLKRPRVERVAAAIGGIAPDLDALWAWLSHAHVDAYPLVHRGFSHTAWGAPVLATILLWLLANQPWIGRWRQFENVWFTKQTILPLWLGAWTHLVLDGLTITGVPLLWPFENGRYTLDWFFFGVPYLVPISLTFWILAWRGKTSDRVVTRLFALLVGILLIAGTVRYVSYPNDLVGDEDVTPGPVEWQWIVSRREEAGVRVHTTTWGGDIHQQSHFVDQNYEESESARHACEASVGYVPWSWTLWGLAIVHAHQVTHSDNTTDWGDGRVSAPADRSIENGTWILRYYDAGELHNDRFPALRLWWNPARTVSDFEEGAVCVFEPDGDVWFQRSRGWIGS